MRMTSPFQFAIQPLVLERRRKRTSPEGGVPVPSESPRASGNLGLAASGGRVASVERRSVMNQREVQRAYVAALDGDGGRVAVALHFHMSRGAKGVGTGNQKGRRRRIDAGREVDDARAGRTPVSAPRD